MIFEERMHFSEKFSIVLEKKALHLLRTFHFKIWHALSLANRRMGLELRPYLVVTMRKPVSTRWSMMRFHITRAAPTAKECENSTTCPECSD